MVRFKNRWLLVEFIPVNLGDKPKLGPSNLDGKTIYAALRQSVITNFGDTGWGAVGLSLTVKYFSPMTNVCIIRVARDPHKVAWAAVTLLTSIEGIKYIPNVVHLSGTIKHVQLAAIEHNRLVVARYRAQAKLSANYKDSYDNYLESSEKEIEKLQD
ncbi:hypothetical protein BDQ17DRAFT_1431321 [Cyathus striatus]|nr:hypothetical protein BDQ17DRAFT_1431321 [Cyathus striatus]